MKATEKRQDPVPAIDPNERRWLERKALELVREHGCSLSSALVAARCEFESLRSQPKAVVIPLVGRARSSVSRPQGARS